MAKPINILAWLLAVVTIVIWAALPQVVSAYPILLPKAPVVTSTLLPSAPLTDRRETER
ncbi:hypothetical protein [Marivita sp.]|uniref:hypothetical protein n=1 Tax=Marivita sp. TaxID=2003365 RepID=UPI0025C4AC55|nr:hypothetical protein [Marivita sp.]